MLLGECELELHRREEALAAWARVARASPYFSRAAVLQATHLINSGRYTPAEEILLRALERPDPDAQYELERTLTRLYRFEGRFDDVRRLVRASWSRSPTPASALKELWTHDHSPMPVESWNRVLQAADADDDRVWLGHACQAILTGRFADAADWLDRCIKRRPDDRSVWRARLELAQATGDAAGCRTASGHVPADRFDNEALRKLRAWMTASLGDDASERHELLALIEGAPGNTQALERLAVLMFQAGQPGEAEKLHRRKAEIDRAEDRYRKMLFDGDDLSARADVLAQLSTKLGRPFDARAWGIVAAARLRDPGPARGGSRPVQGSPLPESLLPQAVALSSPFAIFPRGEAPAASMLGELLADLRPAPAAHGLDAATASRAIASPVHLSRAIPEFVDDAEAVGLRFVFDNGQTAKHLLPETMSGGVAPARFRRRRLARRLLRAGGNADRRPTSRTRPPHPWRSSLPQPRRRDVRRREPTQPASPAIAWGRGYGLGVTVGDYDNDGRPDLFVTRLAAYSLYRNRGDGTFEDVTVSAGLAGRRDNPTSAAFADLDNDGDLDLYVCHYMMWDPAHPRLCQNEKGEYFYCDPSKVEPAPDHVFRNDGGRFVDVTASSGCAETNGRGLGVVAADLDDDNRIDLYVANDGTANYLFRNLGNFHFEEVGLRGRRGRQCRRGIPGGDGRGLRRPGRRRPARPDGDQLLRRRDHALSEPGPRALRRPQRGFGHRAGHPLPAGLRHRDGRRHQRRPARRHDHQRPRQRQSALIIFTPCPAGSTRTGRTVDWSTSRARPARRGTCCASAAAWPPATSTTTAASTPSSSPRTSHWRISTTGLVEPGHFVTFRLEGTRSNRDGVGARVTVTAGGRRQVLERCGGGSYQSASDPRLHFGLAESTKIEQVEVRWPSGQVDRHADLAADSGYLLREGDVKPQPLAE